MKRILHIEDDAAWRELVRTALEGYDVESVPDVHGALAAMREPFSYDAVIVDLNLTADNDLGGGDILDLVRVMYPAIRVIVLTGAPPIGPVRRNIFERYDVDELLIKTQLTLQAIREAVVGPGPSQTG